MNKSFHFVMMWINLVFMVTNAGFMYVVTEPLINFVCAMVSLIGLMCSWMLYKQAKENEQ